jgi:hypothetical protein
MSRFSLFQGGDGAAPRGLASTLLRCHSINEMRHLAPLPKDAQELIDRAVVQVGLDRLVLVADLMAEGLTFPIADPLSVMEVTWENEALIGHAIRTMQPSARGERQLPDRKIERIPIYATIDDFSFDSRLLRASQRAGTPIDVSMVAQATRRVNESIEDSAFNGAGITVTGNDAPGVLNAPGVNTETLTASWVTATGEQMLGDVLDMADELRDVRRFGPYNLYIPTAYGNSINADFKANSDKTIRMRLEELAYGGRNLRVRVADFLPDDTVVMLQMTSDIIDVITGQSPTAVSWQDGPGWQRFFAIISFTIPRVKVDYEGNTGIVVGTL